MWDFNIQTNHVIEARRPGMIVIDKETNFAKIIDFAIPYDTRVNSKEVEEMEKYQDLAYEIKKLWGMRLTVIPIIIGLGKIQYTDSRIRMWLLRNSDCQYYLPGCCLYGCKEL